METFTIVTNFGDKCTREESQEMLNHLIHIGCLNTQPRSVSDKEKLDKDFPNIERLYLEINPK